MSCHQLAPRGDSLFTLLRHLPTGVAWIAFRMPGKVAHKLFKGLALAYEAMSEALCYAHEELDPRKTEDLITEWETALGLPDACLPTASTLDERREQIMFRLEKRRWTTAAEWHEIASLFGLSLRITPGWTYQKQAVYPSCYPKLYLLLERLGRFHIYIDIIDGCDNEGYAYTYPMNYGFTDRCAEFRCILNRIKPANVVIVYNEWPAICGCNGVTFSEEFSVEFC